MKLRCKKIPVCEDCGKWLRVFGSRERVCACGKRKAVHKIEVTTVLDARKQVMRLRLMNLAPAHVGHGILRACLQLLSSCRDKAKARRDIFLGALREQLHAKADSKYRLAKCCYDLAKVIAVEFLHRIGRSAHTGKDYVAGGADRARVPRQHAVDAQTIQGKGQ